MSLIEPFIPEGIDPTINYTFQCIDRVNKKVDAITPSGIGDLITQVANLTTKSNNSYIVVNVKDFGAKGDGTTDDTTSINNAIATLGLYQSILYFPMGQYKVSGTIYIANLNNVCLKSDNAIIINNNYNGFTLSFYNCVRATTEGNLGIIAGTSGLSQSCGLKVERCVLSVFTNIYVANDFNVGIFIGQEGPRANPQPYGLSATFNNLVVRGCRYGIFLGGEYYLISNSHINYNTVVGIYSETTGGNNSIDNCGINFNNVGICVVGQNLTNSDHSKITNNVINHNNCCGIYLKNIEYTMSICNNQIWANYSSNMGSIAPLPLPLSTLARTVSFGIYMENVINVNIQGNTISRNYLNIGLDGWALCNISNNSFLLNSTNNIGHITEFGENNTRTANTNMLNTITNNIFDVAAANEYLAFYDSEKSVKYLVKGNRGTAGTNPLFIGSVGNYFIGNRDHYIINANNVGLSTSPPNTPAGVNLQATNITILPILIGEEFEITFSDTNLTNYFVWLRFKTNNTSTAISTTGNGIFQHIPANKAICINTRLCNRVKFTPYGVAANQWVCSGLTA